MPYYFFKKLALSSPFFVTVISLIFIGVLGFIDYTTGSEIAFSIFYLIPVCFVTWYAGGTTGIIISILSAGAWLLADISPKNRYSVLVIAYWNALVRMCFFIIINQLLCRIKRYINYEKSLARIDPLTGLLNSRTFKEEGERFFSLASRYKDPLTLIYIDIDDFKYINDSYGHNEGDRLLKVVADSFSQSVRSYDLVARLGGDEFVILLPKTEPEEARKFVTKIIGILYPNIKSYNWTVTFSIGVATFAVLPDSLDQAVNIADQLMYRVKRSGKNNVTHGIFNEQNLVSKSYPQRKISEIPDNM